MEIIMNRCFLMGKLIEKNDFKFIINKRKKHKSQIKCKLKLRNGSIIDIIAYDKNADLILRKEMNFVYIDGILEQTEHGIHVEIREIYYL